MAKIYNFVTNSPISFNAAGKEFSLNAGDCFSLPEEEGIKALESSHHYSKYLTMVGFEETESMVDLDITTPLAFEEGEKLVESVAEVEVIETAETIKPVAAAKKAVRRDIAADV